MGNLTDISFLLAGDDPRPRPFLSSVCTRVIPGSPDPESIAASMTAQRGAQFRGQSNRVTREILAPRDMRADRLNQHATHTNNSDKEITAKQLKAERKHQRSRTNVDPQPRQRNANGQRNADGQRIADGRRINTGQRPTSSINNRAIR
ncbi:hypothetical protein EAG_05116 [Camponotus floridanus]|uniref:Uncharacterized protein n=1 Tax=Camponotus floridanus TaxID=104421 RepID=E2AYT8_CAMFO|nr:hypothetical protein EAG_05116 [Camponotus floridanus]